MSTSPNRRLDPLRENSVLQPFPYDLASPPQLPMGGLGGEIACIAEGDNATREAEIRAIGQKEGETFARKKFEADVTQERSRLVAALAQFSLDRETYWHAVEAEIVHLALSIARKVLHREAQVDPLILSGAVRVALEKIDGATSVVLRVHPQCADGWRQFIRGQLVGRQLPEIIEDSSQPPDGCCLETSMGRVELGLDFQFKEIEQGLMDLLDARR